jgi:hypothetical protein
MSPALRFRVFLALIVAGIQPAFCRPPGVTTDQYQGKVVAMTGKAVYKSSRFDARPKPVRAGMRYYPGFEFQLSPGTVLQLHDLNSGEKSKLTSKAGWYRITLQLNGAQKELVAQLSKVDWSVSPLTSALVGSRNDLAKVSAAHFLILRRAEFRKHTVRVRILTASGKDVLHATLPAERSALILSPAQRRALSVITHRRERTLLLELKFGSEAIRSKFRLLSAAEERHLQNDLQVSNRLQNQLTRTLAVAEAYRRAGCIDNAAYTLSQLPESTRSIGALGRVRPPASGNPKRTAG